MVRNCCIQLQQIKEYVRQIISVCHVPGVHRLFLHKVKHMLLCLTETGYTCVMADKRHTHYQLYTTSMPSITVAPSVYYHCCSKHGACDQIFQALSPFSVEEEPGYKAISSQLQQVWVLTGEITLWINADHTHAGHFLLQAWNEEVRHSRGNLNAEFSCRCDHNSSGIPGGTAA